jgi:hypothetical protein
MIMLLLDFKKAYDRVKWGFLEGTLNKLGFSSTWIAWVSSLYIDSWYSVGLNGQTSDPFKLTRSIRQGCSLAPFLYLFVADCLGYILEQDAVVAGLKLPENGGDIIDQEFADDTNLYLEGSFQNLDSAKRLEFYFNCQRQDQLEQIARYMGSRKPYAIHMGSRGGIAMASASRDNQVPWLPYQFQSLC